VPAQTLTAVAPASSSAPAPAATTAPHSRARPAANRDRAQLAVAQATRLPGVLHLQTPADGKGPLWLLAFLLGVAYAGGLRLVLYRDIWDRRRSATAALVSRHRARARGRH
jgi:hypothetical protein